MSKELRIRFFVGGVAVAGFVVGAIVLQLRLEFPGWWPLATFVFVASLLEGLGQQARLSAKGSLSFIMHMSAALLFGGWWAVLVAVVSTLVGELARNSPSIKLVFNVSQRILTVGLAALVYESMGGRFPPAYLIDGGLLSSDAVQRDLGVFFAFAAVYFLVNATAVTE